MLSRAESNSSAINDVGRTSTLEQQAGLDAQFRDLKAAGCEKIFTGNCRTRESQGADLCILNLGADTSTATGRLMFTVIGAVGAFEREPMLERQREGIAKAKADGRYKGRKATARARSAEIKALKADGVRPTDIARRLGIGRASVYRILESGRS